MHWYWMETTHLAPLYRLDPSLPFRRLGRRYVQKRQFNKQQGWANKSIFCLAAGLENNIIEQQIDRHLLWAEINVSISVFVTESIFFFQFDVKKCLPFGHWKVKARKGYLTKWPSMCCCPMLTCLCWSKAVLYFLLFAGPDLVSLAWLHTSSQMLVLSCKSLHRTGRGQFLPWKQQSLFWDRHGACQVGLCSVRGFTANRSGLFLFI